MKEAFLDKAVRWAKGRGFSQLRAQVEGLEPPASFQKQSNGDDFTPDITGLKRTNKSYIEIALKSETVQRQVSKWKLLSTLAARKGGKLFLLAPHGHKAHTEKILNSHSISAEVVSI